jgi:hypothetical protein
MTSGSLYLMYDISGPISQVCGAFDLGRLVSEIAGDTAGSSLSTCTFCETLASTGDCLTSCFASTPCAKEKV